MIYFIIITILLLFCSAFFSSLETGLLALGDVRISEWAAEKIKSLKIWIEDPAVVITGILIGNNLVNITFTSIFTVLVVHFVNAWDIPVSWTEIISIICSSALILVFGEIIPKTFANTYPDRIVSSFYKPYMRFYDISSNLVNILNKVSFSLLGAAKMKKEKPVSRKELHVALEDIEENGLFEKDSSRMLGKVLFLTRRTAGEVMVPRNSIFGVDLKWEYEKIIEALLDMKYSRIPAYCEKIDDIKGFIYIKDVIRELNKTDRVDFYKILRKPHLTYPGRNCQHLFQDLRKKRVHCSVVKVNEELYIFSCQLPSDH
ncbi:CNNM domain-containing protein [Elusimicrobiota bacterium]